MLADDSLLRTGSFNNKQITCLNMYEPDCKRVASVREEKQGCQQLIQNIIKISPNMMQAKLKRRIRAQSRNNPPQIKKTDNSILPSKLTLRKLSFSFYGEDTLRNHKQIILDNCDTFNEAAPIPLLITESCLKFKSALQRKSCTSRGKHKDSSLKMEKYFFDGKCDEIDLVPTNTSHFEHKNAEGNVVKKKQKSRASSVKYKDVHHELKLERHLGCGNKMRCKSSCKGRKDKGKGSGV